MPFIRLIIKICTYVFKSIYSKIDHVGYAKYIGVDMGKNIFIYGDPRDMFGTEPWAISLGSNIYI
jgi:hypothetical protein